MDMEIERWMGQKVEIYWPEDDDWYEGRVTDYNARLGGFHIDYDDGMHAYSSFPCLSLSFFKSDLMSSLALLRVI